MLAAPFPCTAVPLTNLILILFYYFLQTVLKVLTAMPLKLKRALTQNSINYKAWMKEWTLDTVCFWYSFRESTTNEILFLVLSNIHKKIMPANLKIVYIVAKRFLIRIQGSVTDKYFTCFVLRE